MYLRKGRGLVSALYCGEWSHSLCIASTSVVSSGRSNSLIAPRASGTHSRSKNRTRSWIGDLSIQSRRAAGMKVKDTETTSKTKPELKRGYRPPLHHGVFQRIDPSVQLF